MDIHPTDLRRIDLNLLVSLDALLAALQGTQQHTTAWISSP